MRTVAILLLTAVGLQIASSADESKLGTTAGVSALDKPNEVRKQTWGEWFGQLRHKKLFNRKNANNEETTNPEESAERMTKPATNAAEESKGHPRTSGNEPLDPPRQTWRQWIGDKLKRDKTHGEAHASVSHGETWREWMGKKFDWMKSWMPLGSRGDPKKGKGEVEPNEIEMQTIVHPVSAPKAHGQSQPGRREGSKLGQSSLSASTDRSQAKLARASPLHRSRSEARSDTTTHHTRVGHQARARSQQRVSVPERARLYVEKRQQRREEGKFRHSASDVRPAQRQSRKSSQRGRSEWTG